MFFRQPASHQAGSRTVSGRGEVFAAATFLAFFLSSTVYSGPALGGSSASSTHTIACGVDVSTRHAMVVSADSIASAVGNQVLMDGGNAVDAAVAVGFALAVTLPRAGNIGGGGFMLIRLSDGNEDFIDYREKAPLAASRDMYLDENGDVITDLSTVGLLAAGVPGTVYGLRQAHETYGTLPWDRLLEPAVRLARDGFVVGEPLAASLAENREYLSSFDETRRVFVDPDYRAGDLLVQADLARTLQRVAKDWKDFYEGETARLIAAEMRDNGGLITIEDLLQYRSAPREPIHFDYRGYHFTAAPLPSSGGVMLAQLFQILERHRVWSLARNSTAYVHLVSEAEKIVYRSRALYLGDGDFYPSPWDKLTESGCASRMAQLIHSDRRLERKELESVDLLPGWSAPSGAGRNDDETPPDKGSRRGPFEQTTHFSIVDRWGNAVANTYTLNDAYGCAVVVRGAGFLLNNEMDDFAIKPGHPNLYGLVGSDANAVAPGKRMLSSMSPTIVTKNEKLCLVLGSPGGARIPTAVFQVIVNVLDHGMSAYDAVCAGRFHHQYLPDRIYAENGALERRVVGDLIGMGHKIEIREPMGNVQVIHVKDGVLYGASDPRSGGLAVGY